MSDAPGITLTGGARIDGAQLFAPITLPLSAGQWTCLLGGSGVGKSTVLRLISGLATEAAFDGKIKATDGAEIASRVAYMAQSDLLLPWATVTQNATLGARLRGERADPARLASILSRVGLAEHADKTPDALSGGQRQRVALARTLMEDKPIILLDEPFSALDAQTRADMQELTAELLAGRTVLLVTHDPGEAARLGQHIYILDPHGLHQAEAPKNAPPRPATAPDVLQTQADLLTFLRKS